MFAQILQNSGFIRHICTSKIFTTDKNGRQHLNWIANVVRIVWSKWWPENPIDFFWNACWIAKLYCFQIKVVRNPGDDERLAYVNFERRDCARKVRCVDSESFAFLAVSNGFLSRYTVMDRLRKALGRRVLCDPAGILRDQEGKYIPDRFNRALQVTISLFVKSVCLKLYFVCYVLYNQ